MARSAIFSGRLLGPASSSTLYMRLPPVQEVRPPPARRTYCVHRAPWSCAAAWSLLSALALCSVLSAGSLGAVGSIGSILSVGSVGSIGSLFSFNSTFSVLAHSCSFGLFHDCRKHGPAIEWSRVPRRRDPYAMWNPCKRVASGAKITKTGSSSAGFVLPPGAVGKCGGDHVFLKERAEIRTGTFRTDRPYRLVFNMQARTTDPNIDSWLSVFQIKCTRNGPPPYMLLLGSAAHPSFLQVRHKSTWGATTYMPLLGTADWQNAKRLKVTLSFDLRSYMTTTVEGRHGEVASVTTTGPSWCEGSAYLKFGLYREHGSAGGTARLGIGNIQLHKLPLGGGGTAVH